ncbi:MAG: ElyC/SanA/YdcF family protein [Candidatus Pacebacteria bacterium]|nr:ElyC/SanA/YdcF family protein [Candidatus Paceibacterota bacterium]
MPDEVIFLDHAGFDTYSSMYRARDVFLVSSIIVATQSFHLPRAIFIAHSLDIKAYGFSADSGSYSIKNYFRELFANVRAVFDLAFLRVPKYLGSTIPIAGDNKNNQ